MPGYVLSAGDSRAVLCRGGTALALSEDHKPSRASERARIMAAGGFLSEIGGITRVNGNLNLSRAIGDLRYKMNHQVGWALGLTWQMHLAAFLAAQSRLLGCCHGQQGSVQPRRLGGCSIHQVGFFAKLWQFVKGWKLAPKLSESPKSIAK